MAQAVKSANRNVRLPNFLDRRNEVQIEEDDEGREVILVNGNDNQNQRRTNNGDNGAPQQPRQRPSRRTMPFD